VSGLDLHALRFGITHHFGASAVTTAPVAYTKALPPVARTWDGLYGGVSFGVTSMNTHTASTSNEVFNFTQTEPGFAFNDVQVLNTVFNTHGSHVGAIGDIFAGYNVRFGGNVIAGAQVEGSLAHASTRGTGASSTVFTITEVETPPGGAAGTNAANGTASGTAVFAVQSRWMASALGRLGWLFDPRDLAYVIGGWTYGSFTTGSRVFGLNGPTIGAGIEREVAPSWTVKAEYRYTHFQRKDVPFSQTQTQTQTIGTTTASFNDVFNETDRISVNLHAVRFGIVHYFASL
jgi:opacity protein-like surface antigen